MIRFNLSIRYREINFLTQVPQMEKITENYADNYVHKSSQSTLNYDSYLTDSCDFCSVPVYVTFDISMSFMLGIRSVINVGILHKI